MNLSPVQFYDENERAAGGQVLPGMEKRSVYAQTADWQDETENRNHLTETRERRARKNASGPLYDRWTGPDPHQLIMGVHDLAQNNGQPDMHGFIHEHPHFAGDDVISPDQNFLGQGGNGKKTTDLMRKFGGAKKHEPDVQEHWASQPLHMVPTNTIVHTRQSPEETEQGKAYGDPMFRALYPGRQEGRERVNAIRDDVEHSGGIRQPAWLVRHNSRLYSMDGHHRIVAAREAGAESYPAHVWDLDAQKKR